jgi:hypothetical protein
MGVMQNKLHVWLHGLAAAVIGGVSTAASAAFVDSRAFNFTHAGLIGLAKVSTTGGLIAALAYLKQSPLP